MSPRKHSKSPQRQSNSPQRRSMSPRGRSKSPPRIDSKLDQKVQESSERTLQQQQNYPVPSNKRSEKLITVQTRGERHRSHERNKELSPKTAQRFAGRENNERSNTSSSEEHEISKPNDLKHEQLKFAFNRDTGRHRTQGTSSSSDSEEEEEEESRDVLHRQRKHSHRDAKEKDKLKRKALSHTNEDKQFLRTVSGNNEFEEDHRTSGTVTQEAKIQSHTSTAMHKQDEINREYRKSQNTHNDKQDSNDGSSGSEQEDKHASLEGEGRQGSPEGKTNRRSRSRSSDSDKGGSCERARNRKSRHHHHHHHHHRHRHHHKRNARQSEKKAVTQRD